MKARNAFAEIHRSGMNTHKAFDIGLLSRIRLPFATQDNYTFYHLVVRVALSGPLKLVCGKEKVCFCIHQSQFFRMKAIFVRIRNSMHSAKASDNKKPQVHGRNI